jgi:hypothetical protein
MDEAYLEACRAAQQAQSASLAVLGLFVLFG